MGKTIRIKSSIFGTHRDLSAPDLFEILLLILIVIGLFYRFSWMDWNQGTNLHPDEYGLTNTLTGLRMPASLSEYFNTRLSPLSPYHKYDLTGQLTENGPDNRMRWGQWPIILIRGVAELTGNTGYNELRLTGRYLSALADVLSVFLTFLIGLSLYNRKVGLLAASLSALAVMQIQQSHFMTVDNFGVLFTVASMYLCVKISQKPCVYRQATLQQDQTNTDVRLYRLDRNAWKLYVLFGISLGMAIASRINLLPLGGMVLIGSFISIADLKLRYKDDLYRIFGFTALHILMAFGVALITFRLTQPMSFRQPSGDTTVFTFHLNQDWVDSMEVAQAESNGVGGGPPGEQWANRQIIFFPLINMILWGMGIPLGLMSWAGFIAAGYQIVRGRSNWRSHLLPFVWVGGYFFFMATRWVMSVRYFLPVYPFLCLFAAWGLIEQWRWCRCSRRNRSVTPDAQARIGGYPSTALLIIPIFLIASILFGTLGWAHAFISAVYRNEHTRIQAARWIYRNIPAPFHLSIEQLDGLAYHEPIPAPDNVQIGNDFRYIQPFVPSIGGSLKEIAIPHATVLSGQGTAQLSIVIATDPDGKIIIDEAIVSIKSGDSDSSPGSKAGGEFHGASIEAGSTYYLIASSLYETRILISRSVIANENWDEGLPMPIDGRDPFGQLYRGVTMEIRWYDDENKRRMMIDVLEQADYIVLPSQRAIWSTCRIPMTYPMTMEYYRALFDGRLGFELAALFQAPLHVGPLYISDVGGTVDWGRPPELPLFNSNMWAAEEAFSVYDHPPVWIFQKRPDFSIETAERILYSVDLSQVVIQSPRDATGTACK